MRGAPWEGLFYGFVLTTVVGLGAAVYALQTQDFLGRTVAWLIAGVALVGAVRIARRAARQPEPRERPKGRSWFGG